MTKLKLILGVLTLIGAAVIILYINRVQYKTKSFQSDVLFSATTYKLPQGEDANTIYTGVKTTKSISSIITVKQIHSGDLKVPLSNALNLEHQACAGLKDKEIEVPIFAYLIHHEKYGDFLIDTGCDASFINNPYGSVKGILVSAFIPKTKLQTENSIENQLAERKKDIKGVFFTHLHPDHTAGLKSLDKNLIYVAGKGEEALFIKFLLEVDHLNKDDIVYMLDFKSEKAFSHPIGKAIDIFGDNSLLAISTPGHTKGHVSYLVNSKKSPILIAGDACILNESMETGAGPGTSAADSKLAQETFERIYNFMKENTEVKLWPGHDFPK